MRVKIRYYLVRKGRGYWNATKAMQTAGFPASVPLGPDGPAAWAAAERWNAKWDAHRRGESQGVKCWPPGSFGDAFDLLRTTDAWRSKAHDTRLEWETSWSRIAPIFGDVAPRTITLADVDGFYAMIRDTAGIDTGWRVIKTWRARWKAAAAMGYCERLGDPSMGIARQTPPRRTARWTEGEVVRMVKAAWRGGNHGLACIIAVAYDSQLSPGDVRKLTPAHRTDDGAFATRRGKTGAPVIATISRRTIRLVAAYEAETHTDATPLANTPLFRATDGNPYKTKAVLSRSFSRLRARVFGPDDTRTLMDLRRTGAMEALVGGADLGHLGSKMGNSIAQAQELQRVYQPVDRMAVESADASRRKGRSRLLSGSNSAPKRA